MRNLILLLIIALFFATTPTMGQCSWNPVITTLTPTPACLGDSITIQVNGAPGNSNYLWVHDTDPSWYSFSRQVTLSGDQANFLGTYRVIVTDSANCIKTANQAIIAGSAPPWYGFPPPITVCTGSSFQLTANPAPSAIGPMTYYWEYKTPMGWAPAIGVNGITTIANTLTCSGNTAWQGTQQFRITMTSGSVAYTCPNQMVIPVTFVAPPTMNVIAPSASVCIGSTIAIQASLTSQATETWWTVDADTTTRWHAQHGITNDTFAIPAYNTASHTYTFHATAACGTLSQSTTFAASSCVTGSQQLQSFVNGAVVHNRDTVRICENVPITIGGMVAAGNIVRVIMPAGGTYQGTGPVWSKTFPANVPGVWKIQARSGSTVLKTDTVVIIIASVTVPAITAPITSCKGTPALIQISSPASDARYDWTQGSSTATGSFFVATPGTIALRITQNNCVKDTVINLAQGTTPLIGSYATNGHEFCCGTNVAISFSTSLSLDSATITWYHTVQGIENVIVDGIHGQDIVTGATTKNLYVAPTATAVCGGGAWGGVTSTRFTVTLPGYQCPFVSDAIETIGLEQPAASLVSFPQNGSTLCLGDSVLVTMTMAPADHHAPRYGYRWRVDGGSAIVDTGNAASSSFVFRATTTGFHRVTCTPLVASCAQYGEYDVQFNVTDCSTICIPDTEYITTTVTVHDTAWLASPPTMVHDTIWVPLPSIVHDTAWLPGATVTIHDTAWLPTNPVHDTLWLASPPTVVHDTLWTTLTVTVHDTIWPPCHPVHDTAWLPTNPVHDTVWISSNPIHDTVWVPLPSIVHDTVWITLPGETIVIVDGDTATLLCTGETLVTDFVTISPPDPFSVWDAIIFDMNGHAVMSPMINIQAGTADIGLLAAGHYFTLYREHGGKRKFVCRFVKLL